MADIFEGLESLGFKNIKMDIFEKEEEKKNRIKMLLNQLIYFYMIKL